MKFFDNMKFDLITTLLFIKGRFVGGIGEAEIFSSGEDYLPNKGCITD